MTKLLENAVETLRRMPPAVQDTVARMMIEAVGQTEIVEISIDHEQAVLRSREAAARGEFATDADMKALWSKFDL